ncbi:MAG: T9SS type A sorting domain-containing protein [Saprospirales bacterium]|nr:T9SS type A sorting domain-containing protein [Saprospirales bacterium]
MEKTNFTNLRSLVWLALPIAMLFFQTGSVSAQTMVCNDNVQVSVDPTPDGTCQIDLTADMILEGAIPSGNLLLEVLSGINVLYSGINVVSFSGSSHLGQTLVVRVTHMNSGNKCWGSIKIEDKAAPVCFGEEVTIPCTQDYNNVPFPDVADNCDLSPDVELANQTINTSSQCSPNGGYVLVTRTFLAIDASGNQSAPCTQYITIERPAYVDFPNDITWECTQYASYSNITAATALHPTVKALQSGTNVINATGITNASVLSNTGSGIPDGIVGQYCNYQYTHADQTLVTCGTTFKIVRTWTVLDWCTGMVVTGNPLGEDNIQIVKVADHVAPTIVRAPFSVSANIPGQHPLPCKSQGYLQPASVSDACSNWTIRIFTPVGEAIYLNGIDGTNGGFIPAPGLGLGTYQILYQAIDECNNIAELYVSVQVIDDIVPTTICDEITDVNLSSDGKAIVPANTFDDGSYDNCCLDKFVVRRMNGDCSGNFDDFGPTVTFCCSDIPANPVTVVFRAIDCYGNYNDCMVTVNVNDKLPPSLLSCPQAQTITCDNYLQNYAAGVEQGNYSVLNGFGTPTFYDNCNYNTVYTVTVNLNNCSAGQIIRKWTASDQNGQAVCTQVINVNHVSNWVVEFPADFTGQCTNGQLPDTGEPEIFLDECELIGVAHSDQVFTVVPDACYKIVRTWNVINWCIYDDFGYNAYSEAGKAECNLNVDWDGDGDKDCRTFRDGWNSTGSPGTPDGYITFKQTIKVIDNEAPDFTIPAIDGCITDTDCNTNITLPYPDISDDCSLHFDVDITGELGNFNNITGNVTVANVGVGEYDVTYSVMDNCGNTAYETITVVVTDCKKPTPLCDNGLVIEIMQTGMVEVWAEDFDEGSFDNCGPIVAFSFSPDVNDLSTIYTCDDLGQQPVQVWVTDIYGNQDYCETFVVIQDNMFACNSANGPTVAGAIANEEEEGVEGVSVELSGNGSNTELTGSNGTYSFGNIPSGGDYTVTPVFDVNDGNGVTTYDLVLITRHILGIQSLNSPYKIIAADANRSNSVTTSDMVEIRKIILQLIQVFPNNTSWRFVDKDFVFPNPANPFSSGFPEVISFNNLSVSELYADFVAVKVGDVNGSAATNAMGDTEDRTLFGTLALNVEDQQLVAGNTYTVALTADNLRVLGYQFTLNFDNNALELINLIPGQGNEDNFGLHLLEEGAITTSWNGEMTSGDLFSLVFKANDNALLSDLLSVGSRFTKAEAYDLDGRMLDISLSFNGQIAGDKFELYQNVPNPFNGKSVIGFNLPETGVATLKVVDLSGKVLKLIRGEFAKGYNQIVLQANDLPGSGVLYYSLETAGFTATKKMVIVK